MFNSLHGIARRLRAVARHALNRARRRTIVTPVKDFGNLYAHERMLADRVRMDAYRRAIGDNLGHDDTVLDLGTGTGVLAMLASRQGCRRVYAVDHSPFIEIAREIADRNDCRNITFLQVNSRLFDPPEKIDVILHEQIGDDLFEEDMVENILDLKRRVLKSGGRILPGSFELFLDPVSIKDSFRLPFIWENPVAEIDLSYLRGDPRIDQYMLPGYDHVMTGGWAVEALLTEPRPVLEVDLNEIDERDEIPRVLNVERTISTAGRMDGLLLSFGACFDGGVRFDTLPSHERTHWMNRLFRTPCREVAVGDIVRYSLQLDDLLAPATWLTSFE